MTKRRPETVIDQSDSRWHWDKKVPIALIGTFVISMAVQGLTAAWWASKADSRIEFLEKAHAAAGPQTANQGERLTRVEEKLEGVKAGIIDIKQILTAQDARERNGKAVR
jgi:hypothetical protein